MIVIILIMLFIVSGCCWVHGNVRMYHAISQLVVAIASLCSSDMPYKACIRLQYMWLWKYSYVDNTIQCNPFITHYYSHFVKRCDNLFKLIFWNIQWRLWVWFNHILIPFSTNIFICLQGLLHLKFKFSREWRKLQDMLNIKHTTVYSIPCGFVTSYSASHLDYLC